MAQGAKLALEDANTGVSVAGQTRRAARTGAAMPKDGGRGATFGRGDVLRCCDWGHFGRRGCFARDRAELWLGPMKGERANSNSCARTSQAVKSD